MMVLQLLSTHPGESTHATGTLPIFLATSMSVSKVSCDVSEVLTTSISLF